MMKSDKGRLWSEPFGAGYNVVIMYTFKNVKTKKLQKIQKKIYKMDKTFNNKKV